VLQVNADLCRGISSTDAVIGKAPLLLLFTYIMCGCDRKACDKGVMSSVGRVKFTS